MLGAACAELVAAALPDDDAPSCDELLGEVHAASEAVLATWELRVVWEALPSYVAPWRGRHAATVEGRASSGAWCMEVRTPVVDDVASAYVATLRAILAELRELAIPVAVVEREAVPEYVPTIADRMAVEPAARDCGCGHSSSLHPRKRGGDGAMVEVGCVMCRCKGLDVAVVEPDAECVLCLRRMWSGDSIAADSPVCDRHLGSVRRRK